MDTIIHGSTGLQGTTKHHVPRQQKHNSVAKNGRCSADKRSHTINIGYFFMADQHYKGLINVKYCPTSKMWADPMTKPLQGLAFKLNADRLMGRTRD